MPVVSLPVSAGVVNAVLGLSGVAVIPVSVLIAAVSETFITDTLGNLAFIYFQMAVTRTMPGIAKKMTPMLAARGTPSSTEPTDQAMVNNIRNAPVPSPPQAIQLKR